MPDEANWLELPCYINLARIWRKVISKSSARGATQRFTVCGTTMRRDQFPKHETSSRDHDSHPLQKTHCFMRALMACLCLAYLLKCEQSYLEYLSCFYKLIGLSFHEASTQATHELRVWGSKNCSEHNGPYSQA